MSTAVTTVRRRREPWRAVVYGLLALGLVIFIYPYLWMVSGTLMTNEAFYRGDSNYLLPNPFSIYVWKYLFVEIRDVFPIARYTMNSLITTSGAVLIYLVTGTLAGYALARKPVPFKGVIVWLLFATFMFPGITLLIPTFFVVYRLGLINTYLGIILVLAAEPLPFVLLYRFFRDIPVEYEYAGRVDGAADLRILWSILIPLAMPAIVAAGLLGIIMSWNAFIFPFMLATSTDLYTLPVSLLYFQNVQLWSTAHERIGVAVVATLPPIIVFIIAQRKVMSGFTGGLKT